PSISPTTTTISSATTAVLSATITATISTTETTITAAAATTTTTTTTTAAAFSATTPITGFSLPSPSSIFIVNPNFDLLVENLADAIENGTRDQNSDALVTDLNNHFEKCQQLLNSISGSINAKTMTVEGQKLKFEESEQLLNQRKDLIAKYRNSVEELIKAEP
ncbi:hypothetical protein HYC85_028098, partial [Camellia sinensis]